MGCETVAAKSCFFFPLWLQQPHYWPENIHPPPGGSKIGVFKFIASFIPLIVMQYPFSLLPKVKKLRTPNFSRLTRLFFRKPCAFFLWIRAGMQYLHSAVITTSSDFAEWNSFKYCNRAVLREGEAHTCRGRRLHLVKLMYKMPTTHTILPHAVAQQHQNFINVANLRHSLRCI